MPLGIKTGPIQRCSFVGKMTQVSDPGPSWPSCISMMFTGFLRRRYMLVICAKPHRLVGSVHRLESRRLLVPSLAQPIFFPRTDNIHCDRIHFSLTTVHCFNNGNVGNQPVAWKEYCPELVKRSPGKHV